MELAVNQEQKSGFFRSKMVRVKNLMAVKG